MKISKISIKNYRSCSYTEFEPHGNLSALIGPNGSGKTTVLTAIRLLTSLIHVRNRRYRRDEPANSASELKVWYDWNGKTIIHTAVLDIVTNEKNEDEIIDSKESWYMFDVTGSKKRFKMPLEMLLDLTRERKYQVRMGSRGDRFFYVDYAKQQGLTEKAFSAIEEIVRLVMRINYYSASQFTNPSSCPISFEVESETGVRRGISISGHKRLLYDLYQEYSKRSATFNEYLGIVGPDGINLVEDISFNEIQTSSSSYSVMTGGRVRKKERTNLLIIPSFKIAGNSLSPSQLSEGTFKTLALIFYLVTDNSSLLMIEEPEVCVHHGLLSSIVELIKVYSSEKQIIISTHSVSVLDSIDFESVFAVKRDEIQGTTITRVAKKLKKNEMAALKYYLENEGSLGEYWKHGDLEVE